jgi:tetratricopeptide (TPR) repeat protein
MQAERNELTTHAFQRLRNLCEQRGIVWSEIDLRWGITDEQRIRGDVLPICLAEIDRCRPYFLAMLGERYGWECANLPPELVRQYPWLDGRAGSSITELELLHGALNAAPHAHRSFVYLREPAFVETRPASERGAFVERPTLEELRDLGEAGATSRAEARAGKLAALKRRIRESGLRVVDGYRDAESLGDLVFDDLSQAIAEDFPESEPEPPALREARVHESFAESRTRAYLGRRSDFRALDTHVDGHGPPLLVVGESGIGKTALLANWIARRRERDPDTTVIPYYVGASAESPDWRHLVASIAARLGFPIGAETGEAEALRVAFANALHRAAVGRHVVVVDGVNQLEDREGALDLAWLPANLPENVRFVMSTLDGRIVEESRRRGWPMYSVRHLAPRQRERLVTAYLREHYAKTLAPAQRARITAVPLSANPLWVTSLLEELRLFGDHEALDARIAHYLAARSIPKLFELILSRWEHDYERDRPCLVGDAMKALWSARRGLSEIELRDLLGGAAAPLPPLSWSIFQFAASRSIVSRSGRLGFFHEYLREAVRARYLPTGEDERAAHRQLANYFAAQTPSPRRTDELPWQLDRAESWDELARLLSDLDFFHDAWKAHELDVKRYWARLEANARWRRVDAYRVVLESPTAYVRDAGAIATLLDEAGLLSEARSIYERLGSGFEQSNEPMERARALTKLARVEDVLGRRDHALAAHAIAERVFRDGGSREDLLVSLGEQAQIRIRQGAPDSARPKLEEALRIAVDLGDQYNVQSLLVIQAEMLIDEGALDRAGERLSDAERICVKLADQDALQRVYGYRSNLLHAQRRFDEALHFSGLKERICAELGDDNGRAAALNARAVLLSESGRAEEAVGLLDAAEAIYRRIGGVAGLATTLGNRGTMKHREGRLREALDLFEQQEALCSEHGELADLDSSLFNQALARERLGEADRAIELLDDAAAASQRAGHPGVRAEIRMHKARILSERGDHATAFRELKESARELGDIDNRWEQARAFRFMSDTLLAAGRPAGALVAAGKAERLAREMDSPAALANALDRRAKVLAHEGELVGALAARRQELALRRRLGNDTELLATAAEVILLAHRAADVSTMIEAIDIQADVLTRLGRSGELVVHLESAIAAMKGRVDLDSDDRRYLKHLKALLERSTHRKRRARGRGAKRG